VTGDSPTVGEETENIKHDDTSNATADESRLGRRPPGGLENAQPRGGWWAARHVSNVPEKVGN